MAEPLSVSIPAEDVAEIGRLALAGWHLAARKGMAPSPRTRALIEGLLASGGQVRTGADRALSSAADFTDDDGVALLTERDVATLLGVSSRSVRRLASAGSLPRVRVGGATRYRRADVARLMKEN